VDLRNPYNDRYDEFIDLQIVKDWSQLSWKQVGKPFEVKNMSRERKRWEQEHNDSMPVKTSWELFNRSFHEWFEMDVPSRLADSRRALLRHMAKFRKDEVRTALQDVLRIGFWNYAHRIQDGIWDPRGKRALFLDLQVHKPRILFLGAAEGYEAMQLYAMYPGGEAVLVDYDEYCRTHRFGGFPESYPFLGSNPSTGAPRVWYKPQMNLHYLVEDIRNLPFGQEFDIVISVGLLEHFPDELKPEVMDWHRKFLKPGGYAILTTPRNQLRSRLFYKIMEDVMNHTYRELMDIRQMGLYVYENGFDILRHGIIKVHNGIVARPR
jgi:SAM-dependent methyltransferase